MRRRLNGSHPIVRKVPECLRGKDGHVGVHPLWNAVAPEDVDQNRRATQASDGFPPCGVVRKPAQHPNQVGLKLVAITLEIANLQ